MVQLIDKPLMKETEPHLAKFERFEKRANHPAWVFPLRKAGMARFAELGFPTLQDEDWRFTNVAPIAKLPFKPVFELDRDELTAEAVRQFTFGSLAATRLVFVNGHFVEGLSSPPIASDGVVIKSLSAALASDSAMMQQHLGQHAQGADNPFAALNTAFFQDGGFIRVSAGRIVEQPIHLLYISTMQD